MKIVKELVRVPAKFTIPAKTQQARAELLDVAATVPPVTSAETQQHATDVGQRIRQLEKLAEELRKAISGPLDKAAKAVNKLVAEYVAPLKAKRLFFEDQISAFQTKERERVRQEEAERGAEVKRLQASESDPNEGMDDISMQELAAYQQQCALQAVMEAPLPEVQKSKGASTKQVLRWTCTDIHKLYAARPDLCWPPTPKASAIQSSCVPEMPVAGLEMSWELDTSIRSR